MKAFALLAVLFLGVTFIPASASAQTVRAVTTTQSLNEAQPTGLVGLTISDVSGLQVVLSAQDGCVLSGAGTLRAYYYSPSLARWMRNAKLDLVVDSSGRQDTTWPQRAVSVPFGRVYYAADAVTVADAPGGATETCTSVNVRMEGWQR